MLIYTVLIIFGVLLVAGMIAGSFTGIFYDESDEDNNES